MSKRVYVANQEKKVVFSINSYPSLYVLTYSNIKTNSPCFKDRLFGIKVSFDNESTYETAYSTTCTDSPLLHISYGKFDECIQTGTLFIFNTGRVSTCGGPSISISSENNVYNEGSQPSVCKNTGIATHIAIMWDNECTFSGFFSLSEV